MSGWAPKAPLKEWRIDTSAGAPILVYENCSVIQDEDARYVLRLIEADQNPAAPVGVPVAWQRKRRSEDYPDEWRECSKEAFDTINKTQDSPWIARELLAATPSPGEPQA